MRKIIILTTICLLTITSISEAGNGSNGGNGGSLSGWRWKWG